MQLSLPRAQSIRRLSSPLSVAVVSDEPPMSIAHAPNNTTTAMTTNVALRCKLAVERSLASLAPVHMVHEILYTSTYCPFARRCVPWTCHTEPHAERIRTRGQPATHYLLELAGWCALANALRCTAFSAALTRIHICSGGAAPPLQRHRTYMPFYICFTYSHIHKAQHTHTHISTHTLTQKFTRPNPTNKPGAMMVSSGAEFYNSTLDRTRHLGIGLCGECDAADANVNTAHAHGLVRLVVLCECSMLGII